MIEGRVVNQHDTYAVNFQKETRKQDKYIYRDGMLWVPFVGSESVDKSETVYNMQVSKDNSYTANNFTVHNCQDMSVAGKRKGMSKECPKCGYKSVANEDADTCPECGSEMQYTRSGLFMEQIRIIKEMREADERNGRSDQFIRPRFMLWENVVGAFSSNKGEDFRAVLEETAKVKDKTATIPRPPKGKWNTEGCILGDGWSIAWRVLDAQFWGVPQRRRRIALVADFAGQCAGEILFKRKGLSRNFTESRKSWQATSGDIAKGIDASGKHCIGPYDMTHADEVIRECKDGKCNTLNHRMGTGGNQVPIVLDTPQVTMQVRCGNPVGGGKGALLQINKSATLSCGVPQTLFQPKNIYCMATQQGNAEICKNLSPTITAAAGMSGNNQPVAAIPIQDQAISNGRGNGLGVGKEGEPMYSLMSETNHGVCCLEGNGSRPSHRGDEYNESETMYTLNATEQHAVAYGLDRASFNQGINAKYDISITTEQSQTLVSRGPNAVAQATYQKTTGPLMANSHPGSYSGQDAYTDMLVTEPSYIVRRLTPIECARLQGFPDWWLDGLETPEPTGHDIAFWREVFETHRNVVTGAKKPKTDKQIIKWLQNPYSDGAAYKLWGNGIALPCFLYVVEGIKEVLDRTSTE